MAKKIDYAQRYKTEYLQKIRALEEYLEEQHRFDPQDGRLFGLRATLGQMKKDILFTMED